nr:MAG TPA: hypothetical protein [Caudoviricetes sp.]
MSGRYKRGQERAKARSLSNAAPDAILLPIALRDGSAHRGLLLPRY